MKLPEYQAFDQKNPMFEQTPEKVGLTRIDTLPQFEEMCANLMRQEQQITNECQGAKQRLKDYFKQIYTHQYGTMLSDIELNDLPEIKILCSNLMYRGVTEAKYMIFTSAQREWLTGDFAQRGISYKNFVKRLINSVRTNQLLRDYYRSLHIETNDLLYMSMLQHYCNHSPMLDLSHSFEVALYFALDGIKISNSTSELDDYFSLYVFDTYHQHKEWNPIDYFLFKGQENAQNMLEKTKISEELIDTTNIDSADAYTKWMDDRNSGLSDISLALLKNPISSGFVFPQTRKGEGIYWSNLNLMAQQGGFLMYNGDIEPLEVYFAKNNHLPKIWCYNINKRLVNDIKKAGFMRLEKNDIYPDLKVITLQYMNYVKNQLR